MSQEILNKIAAGVVNLQGDMTDVKAGLQKVDGRLDILEKNQDWMIGALSRLDTERLAIVQTLKDHATRIEKLEMKLGRHA